MPTYEYRCKKCGIIFEMFQGMKEKPLNLCTKEVCPLDEKEKGTGEVERLIGAGSGVMFKGSGFYITDYKSGGKHTSSASSPAKPTQDKSASDASSSGKTGEQTSPKKTDS